MCSELDHFLERSLDEKSSSQTGSGMDGEASAKRIKLLGPKLAGSPSPSSSSSPTALPGTLLGKVPQICIRVIFRYYQIGMLSSLDQALCQESQLSAKIILQQPGLGQLA